MPSSRRNKLGVSGLSGVSKSLKETPPSEVSGLSPLIEGLRPLRPGPTLNPKPSRTEQPFSTHSPHHLAVPACPGDWVVDAACAGTGALFELDTRHPYSRWTQRRAKAAKKICAGCPVLDPCRVWALTEPDPAVGLVAGGLTPDERRTIRRATR